MTGKVMSFDNVLARTESPVTVELMVRHMHGLGVVEGMTVIVHSSLSAMGWVCGGAQAVISSLCQALGPKGTLVMPTHSADLSDPKEWENPPVPESWWATIRQTMPAYQPDLTQTTGMGRVPEVFRGMNGVHRSNHPKVSFAAYGAYAQETVGNHALHFSLGEGSPLARLYDLDASILLLGVGYESCTALHLAEYRAEFAGKKMIREGAPILVNGERQWVEYDDVDVDSDDFAEIGQAFEATGGSYNHGLVGQAQSRLVPVRSLVDFGVEWIAKNRTHPLHTIN